MPKNISMLAGQLALLNTELMRSRRKINLPLLLFTVNQLREYLNTPGLRVEVEDFVGLNQAFRKMALTALLVQIHELMQKVQSVAE